MVMLDTRDADFTFAGGDVIAYRADLGVTPPSLLADLTSPTWLCMGWLDTSGYLYKLAETYKDIMAAGSMEPIRTITTGAPKTVQANFLESFNPVVRSVYDNVAMAQLQPGASSTVASYSMPDVPQDNRYAYVFDAFDGDKRIRLFAPDGKVNARGDDSVQMLDSEPLQMTFQLYPQIVSGERTALVRIVDYGTLDLTPYFP